MLLSNSLQYALRMMAVSVTTYDSPTLRADELAKLANVPKAYASKILKKLTIAKILTGNKGHGGGYRLARSPSKIFLIDIIEAIEGDIKPRSCVFDFRRCSDIHPCVLHFRWKKLNTEFQNWARNTSLQDIKNDQGKLFPKNM